MRQPAQCCSLEIQRRFRDTQAFGLLPKHPKKLGKDPALEGLNHNPDLNLTTLPEIRPQTLVSGLWESKQEYSFRSRPLAAS